MKNQPLGKQIHSRAADVREILGILPYKVFIEVLALAGADSQVMSKYISELKLTPIPPSTVELVNKMPEYLAEEFPDREQLPPEHRKFLSYLKKEPINGSDIKEALEIVNDPSVRKWINVMALGNFDEDTIYLLLTQKTDKLYNEEGIAAYVTYFFNTSEMTTKSKYLMVSKETDQELNDLYNLSLKHEKSELLWKLGFTPNISLEDIVKGVVAESYFRFKKTSDDDKAARLGALALKAVDKLKELDLESKSQLEQVSGIDFDRLCEDPKVVLAAQLEETL